MKYGIHLFTAWIGIFQSCLLSRARAHEYEKILNTYKKFEKLFWFTFHYSD